jgi:hypothetical protein
MLAFSSRRPGRQFHLFGLAALLITVPVTGILIVRDPVKAWVIIGAVALLAFLELSPIYWCVGALAAATLSRAFVAVGAPHFINFLHFPLVVGAFAVALLRGRSAPVAKPILVGSISLLALNIVSWLVNGGEPLRPVLNWLVVTEPFLLLYAFLVTPPAGPLKDSLYKLMLGISFLQVPLGVYQWRFVANGNPDLVQGTFIGSGTGAHVSGAVAMLSMVTLVCQGISFKSVRIRTLCFGGAGVLLGLAVIADAKQAIAAFLPGLFLAVLKVTKVRPTALLLPTTFLGLILFTAFHFYAPLQKLGDRALLSGGIQGKITGLAMIFHDMDEHPAAWVLGLGPGNTVSRVALLTPDATLDANSAIAGLGLKTAPLTRKIVAASAANYLTAHSSAWYPACSWFGIVGDLGLVGLGLYLWLMFSCWRMTSASGWLGSGTLGGLVAMGVLGGVYSWLEEPSFTLLVALLVTLAVPDITSRVRTRVVATRARSPIARYSPAEPRRVGSFS